MSVVFSLAPYCVVTANDRISSYLVAVAWLKPPVPVQVDPRTVPEAEAPKLGSALAPGIPGGRPSCAFVAVPPTSPTPGRVILQSPVAVKLCA
jgi:hypothetical protein